MLTSVNKFMKSRVYRHGPCWAVKLLEFGRYNIEIVYAPPHYQIEEHSHPSQIIKLCFLFGRATFFRRSNISGLATADVCWPSNMFRTFTIAWYHSHWFAVSKWPLVFINLEIWRTKPTSAAEDFVVCH